jgi:hypothetical protein
MEETPFHYEPKCSVPGCREAAAYKIAAIWSDGTSRELKNYGLACETHRESQLARARAQRRNLTLAEGETVGEVSLYRFVAGQRDFELARVGD